MPTYIYRCSHCKHQFEKRQKFTDPPIERCPNCRRKSVRKVLQPAPIQFKGSGWYITDSKKVSSATTRTRSNSKKSDSESQSKSESDAASSTPAKSSSGDTD